MVWEDSTQLKLQVICKLAKNKSKSIQTSTIFSPFTFLKFYFFFLLHPTLISKKTRLRPAPRYSSSQPRVLARASSSFGIPADVTALEGQPGTKRNLDVWARHVSNTGAKFPDFHSTGCWTLGKQFHQSQNFWHQNLVRP